MDRDSETSAIGHLITPNKFLFQVKINEISPDKK
jgi:hypothetical protein